MLRQSQRTRIIHQRNVRGYPECFTAVPFVTSFLFSLTLEKKKKRKIWPEVLDPISGLGFQEMRDEKEGGEEGRLVYRESLWLHETLARSSERWNDERDEWGGGARARTTQYRSGNSGNLLRGLGVGENGELGAA